VKGVYINNSWGSSNGKYGIYADGVGRLKIQNSAFIDNGFSSSGVYSGIRLHNCQDGIVLGNQCYDVSSKQKYGVETTGTSNYNLIVANNCRGNINASADIVYVGNNNKVAWNLGRYTSQGSA